MTYSALRDPLLLVQSVNQTKYSSAELRIRLPGANLRPHRLISLVLLGRVSQSCNRRVSQKLQPGHLFIDFSVLTIDADRDFFV